jgi:hypothetical protein
LDRARALLANDPDEMDEEWLAEIIAAVRAEAVAAERERIARRVSDLAHEIATEFTDITDD